MRPKIDPALYGGFQMHDSVRVTSEKYFVKNAPGVITGFRKEGPLRVRLRIAETTVTVFVMPSAMKKDEARQSE
jgi:hypothetical protein